MAPYITTTPPGASSGGGAQGTATVDFGTGIGSNYETVVVTAQATIAADSKVQAWLMSTATVDNNEYAHQIAPIRLTCGDIIPGTGFTIYATTDINLNGTFNIVWKWS